jgi:hypothetical protein
MNRSELKRKISCLLKRLPILLAVIILITSIPSFISRAIFDEKDAITFSEFKSKYTIDNSVLFIGTYVVHINALTDDIYEKASDSASQSGQSEIYYKSELADGNWFDIGDVSNGIKGISNNGIVVPETELDDLFVRYYAGADGILIDLLSGSGVNPFDIPDPYDLKQLEELNPLWLQYTYSTESQDLSQEDFLSGRNSKESGNLRSDVYYYQILSTFFALNLRDSNTDQLDRQLAALNSIYADYKAQGKEDEAEVVYTLMKKVDSSRRAIVFEKLSQLDPNALDTLFSLANGSYYTSSGNFKDSSSEANAGSEPDYVRQLQDSLSYDFETGGSSAWYSSWMQSLGINQGSDGWWIVLEEAAEQQSDDDDDDDDDQQEKGDAFNADNGITEAIVTCISNCTTSYISYSSDALTDVDTVLGHAEYLYSSQVIESSTGGSLDGPIEYLKHILNIKDNIVVDAEGELSLLESSLLTSAQDKYLGIVNGGIDPEYNSVQGESAKQLVLESQIAKTDSVCSELKFIIEAVKNRKSAADALVTVNGITSWAEGLKNGVIEDEYGPSAYLSIETFLNYLKNLAQEIIASDKSLQSDEDALREKKEELQLERDKALDNNDLAGAKKYDAMIAAVDKDINALKGNSSGDGSGDGSGSGSGDGSGSGSGSGDGSGSGSGSGDGSGSGPGSGSGSGSGSGDITDDLLAKAANDLQNDANADLSDIAKALSDLGEDEALKDLKELAEKSGAGSDTLAGINDAMASKSSDSSSGGLSEDDILKFVEDFFGKSFDEMDMKELAVVTVALCKFNRMGNAPAGALASRLGTMGITKKNMYFYSQCKDTKATEYISLKAIGDISAYRYFYDDNKKISTMTSGTRIYIFTNGSNVMYKNSYGEDEEQMDGAIKMSDVPHISETDSLVYFKIETEYIPDSSYAVCYTTPMKSRAEEFLKLLTDQ